jgi:hypothetical protein
MANISTLVDSTCRRPEPVSAPLQSIAHGTTMYVAATTASMTAR